MKSIRCARIVVVADSDHGLVLVARLRQMEVARITSVASLDEGTHLCRTGGADACLVIYEDASLDSSPVVEGDAPGRLCGVPSLMLVDRVTPYLRAAARRRGYLTVVSAAISARMLYRCIGGALQQRRAARRGRRVPAGIDSPMLELPRLAVLGKPTLH